MNTIILFYNYVRVENPEKLAADQRVLCKELGLKGRIIIAQEGINATLEGKTENIEKYLVTFLADPRFSNTHIKKSAGTTSATAFPRLSIKVRSEIVSLGLPKEQDFSPRETTGKYLSAEEFHEMMNKKAAGKLNADEDFEIVDMRNDYEHKVGHFKGSVLPPLENFRDLPKALPTLELLKKKKVVTVCTGGVRCEKASGYLVKNGFEDVYQLAGGIVTYMEKFEQEKGENFLGSLYVFDERVTMAFAPTENRPIIATCEFCHTPSENYINCRDNSCHRHFIICKKCETDRGFNHESALCAACSVKTAV
ncbi:MAG: rhodanese-related sulfurtransferase [bacterium]